MKMTVQQREEIQKYLGKPLVYNTVLQQTFPYRITTIPHEIIDDTWVLASQYWDNKLMSNRSKFSFDLILSDIKHAKEQQNLK